MYIAHLVVVSSEHTDMLKRSIAREHSQTSRPSNVGVMTEEESPDITLLDAAAQKLWDHALCYVAQASTDSMVPLLLQGSRVQESHVWEDSLILDALISKQTGLGMRSGSPAAGCQKCAA